MKYLLFFILICGMNSFAMHPQQLLEKKQKQSFDCCSVITNLVMIAKCCCLIGPYKVAEYSIVVGTKPFEYANNILTNKKSN